MDAGRKVLLLCGDSLLAMRSTDEIKLSEMTTFTSIYTYYFRKILEEMGGFEISVSYFKGEKYEGDYYQEMDLPVVDHTIAMQNKAFMYRPELYERVKKITKGKVCVIGDHDEHIGPEDIIFHARETQHDPPNPKSRWIGWGGDPSIFYPEKQDKTLTIFVDGVYYVDNRKWDLTEEILNDILGRLPKMIGRSGFENFSLRTIGKGGIENITNSDDAHSATRGGNPRIPYSELAKELRDSHIFISGHTESMGLSALEACLAGNYLIIPNLWEKAFIKPDLAKDLHHLYVTVGDENIEIPWATVFENLDVEKSVRMASDKTWNAVVSRVVEELYPAKDK